MTNQLIDYRTILEKALVPPGSFPACYAFSIHKGGSSLMFGMIGDVCRSAQIPAVSLPAALFKQGIFDKDWSKDRGILDVIVPGRLYYGFRQLAPVLLDPSLALREKKSVLLVRDPRDALVSEYYSYGGKHISHALPEKNKDVFLQRAKASEHLSIDEYVLQAARNYLGKLSAYRAHLNFENVLLRRYEEIYFDKRLFLGEIFAHFGFDVAPAILDEAAAKHDVRPKVEDPTKHIRKGTPGDYGGKLRPDTVEKLNELFFEMCSWYGYDLGGVGSAGGR